MTETPTVDVSALIHERDEADRRAGAAERLNAHLEKSASLTRSWLDEAKRAAGYSANVSFDVVWAEALAALLEKRSQPPAIDGMPVMDNGLSTVIEGALEIVRKRDPGMHGLIHNLNRLQGWLDLYVARARASELTPGSADAMRAAVIAAIDSAMAAPPLFGGDDFDKGRKAGLREARDLLFSVPCPVDEMDVPGGGTGLAPE